MKFTTPFSAVDKTKADIAGGKGASLGEMLNAGISVPDGFIVLSTTFDDFLHKVDLTEEIAAVLHSVNHEVIHTVENASEKIQSLIKHAKMSPDMADEILSQFKSLDAVFVAVRSSATDEDGADHAWAGQLDSYLNTTEVTLLQKVQDCWASLFTPRAIFYRFEKGLDTTKISVAVVIQKMVNSEKSGIAFSVHPVTEDRNQLIIEAGLGLGEAIVSGAITPDSYVVEKEPRKILDINISTQERALYRAKELFLEHGNNEWRTIAEPRGSEQVLTEIQILELSEIILKIEDHYGFPCDIEWAFENGIFYIVQSRPITTLTKVDAIDKQEAKKREFFDAQISLTEWLGNMGHQDSAKHREEDNEKRERLAVLNELIGIPFDRPTKFSLIDVVNRSTKFQKYLNEHGEEKCALRLIPLDHESKKLRMRGKTVKDVTENWLAEQDVDPMKYRADYIPHADKDIWSTIFMVNEKGIRGEIIADSHEKLTQGYYNANTPISFEFDFSTWKLVPENISAEKHLGTIMTYLKVGKDKQEPIKQQLDGTFSNNYLNGYFETVDTDQGLWFIDYNRLIDLQISDLQTRESETDIFGQSASVGNYTY